MHVRMIAAMLVMVAACEASDGSVVPDAPPMLVGDARHADAEPFMCSADAAPAIPPGPACLALAPASLQGPTPLGDLAAELSYFGAGDCIDHASATIALVGACEEQIFVQFSYPVTTDGPKRRVATSFDPAWARVELRPPGAAARDVTTSLHVDVANWQEGDGVHSVDITVTFTDPAFALPPLHIVGTFCDWPYYLC